MDFLGVMLLVIAVFMAVLGLGLSSVINQLERIEKVVKAMEGDHR